MPKPKIVNRAAYEQMTAMKRARKSVKDNREARRIMQETIELLSIFAYKEPLDRIIMAEVADKVKKETKADKLNNYSELIFDSKLKGDTASETSIKIYQVSGMSFDKRTIHKYIRNNIESNPRFIELQKAYREDLDDVKLYHKKTRLEILQGLFNNEYRKYEAFASTGALNNVLKLLEQARKESDQQLNQINIFNQTNYIQNIIANEELKRAMGDLPLHELIIGRVAAKTGLHPSILINRLNNSIYAKFNGSSRADLESIKEEPIYPTAMLLDMSEIQKKNKVAEVRVSEEVRQIEVVESKKKQTLNKDSIKEALLRKKAELAEKAKKKGK